MQITRTKRLFYNIEPPKLKFWWFLLFLVSKLYQGCKIRKNQPSNSIFVILAYTLNKNNYFSHKLKKWKMKKIALLLLFASALTGFSQYTTAGTEFNLAFLQNRIDRNGAESNCYLTNYFYNYIYVSNTTLDDANINVNFNGSSVYYLVDGVTYTPSTGNEINFTLSGNSSSTIEIYPYDSLTYTNECGELIDLYDARVFQAMNNCQKQNKSISVSSTNAVPITVFAENAQANSRDVSMILPNTALGTTYWAFSTFPTPMEYPVQHAGANQTGPAEILLLSIEDNTIINFSMPINVLSSEHLYSNFDVSGVDTIVGGTQYSISLDAGEVYQLQSDNFSLTGSFFIGNKPFAVFSGNMANAINCTGTCGNDHIYEQMLPMKNWGKEYIVSPFYDNKPEEVKIISMYDNNNIIINGNASIINQGEELSLVLNEAETMFIDAELPICVAQYTSSSHYDGSHHTANDPSMVMLTPITQPIEGINVSIPIQLSSSNPAACSGVSKTDYINIVTKTNNTDFIYVNDFINPNSLISDYDGLITDWEVITSAPEYSYSIIEVTNSSFINSKPIKLTDNSTLKTGFTAIISGFYCAEAYTFNAGISVTDNTSEISDIDKLNNIEIYPNPTTGEIRIEGKYIEQVEVYNLSGVLIQSSNDKELDLTQEAKGIYFVKVTTVNGVATQKLILE